MVAEKRTEGDIQVTQSGIPTCSGQDVLTRENYRITVMDTRFFFYKEPVYKEPTCRRPKYLKNLYY